MAKNRSKKKRSDDVSMDISEPTVSYGAQPMDTSEFGANSSAAGSLNRKVKKGRPMKRSKNARKMKAVAKAISQNEKVAEKVSKNEGKSVRTQSAKTLYD
ncbi:uncharacterized protein LOC116214595 [Punica granatum]|uniref:Uncharacterized protein LOC116214595 n=1 Tax=Punica granatum TaxID=22663 RepID=A0A6P8E780_PUNGR|nr:uncharacterized protein LOC116214595 [Punica granatum]